MSSASSLNSISITVSDDDSDDLSGKLRIRPRRRHRKYSPKLRRHFLRRIFRFSRRWWPVLLFLPAFALLLFESSKLARKTGDNNTVERRTSDLKPVRGKVDLKPAKEVPTNLNRLDPVTRIIGGVRQPCLKLLNPDELNNLKFPEIAEPNNPLKGVMYKSDSRSHDIFKSNITQNAEASRFNLFTGIQSLQDREDSFKANETAVVHCGFYSEHGGFKISDEDKSYMQTCKAVVSTCAFGGGDDLYQPIGMTEASLEKMLSHRLFPRARYSIWVDSKSQFRRDPLGVFEALLWQTHSVLAISEHGARSSLYDEAKAVVKKNKATPGEVEVQLNQYRRDGMPDDKRFHGKKALSEASIIVREHTPLTNLFMCIWFNEVVRFTSRDQLSFPYVLRRLNMPGINMFPVCVRKDLVNSMGHKRKVKPLINSKG